MNSVDISYINIKNLPNKTALKEFALKVLKKIRIDKHSVSILLCDDSYMKELNKKYRGIEEPTDVLTFCQGEGDTFGIQKKRYAGDIVVSLDMIRQNSKIYGVTLEEEFKRMTIHGILHLFGYDHSEEDSGMITLQEEILRDLLGEKIF